jgi:hypothetical protein
MKAVMARNYNNWNMSYSEYFDLYIIAMNKERNDEVRQILYNPFTDSKETKLKIENIYINDNITE